MSEGLDCLAVAAHPDDAELFAGGTLALAAARGKRVGILALTRGEAATRGTPEARAEEAAAAAKILGLACRENLALPDGGLESNGEQRRAVVEALRRLRPRVLLTHWREDRHPDHRRAHELVRDAAFYAGVGRFGAEGPRWRIEAIAYFLGNTFQPDTRAEWIVDVTPAWAAKCAALEAYVSQFRAAAEDPDGTYIASEGFWREVERRARAWGHRIGGDYAEPFLLETPAHAGHGLVRLLEENPPAKIDHP